MGRGFVAELKRRNVFRMAGLYLAASWLVIEIASTLLPIVGAPDWVERVLVLLLALGLVPALLFAWAYELTPEGLRRDGEVAPEQSIGPQTGRRMDRAIIAVLLLALAYFAVDKFVLSKRAPEPAPVAAQADAPARPSPPALATDGGNSIAVLPLVNDSGDEDQQYFSDGLSEDLITALSSFDGLKVIGRNSSFRFRDSEEESRAIGEKLGVSHLLEGSVRRVGDTVRITTTLVNAADGSAVWSQRYDRPYDNLFALQDEITAAVAAALQARLLEGAVAVAHDDRPPSGNLAAYEAVLQAGHLIRRNNEPDMMAALDLLRRATTIDPEYAQAWALLGRSLARAWGRYGVRAPSANGDPMLQEAAQATARALSLRPDLPSALLADAYVKQIRGGSMIEVERDTLRAVELAPMSADAVYDHGGVLAMVGRLDEAVDVLQHAIQLDPLSYPARHAGAMSLISLGRYREAEERLREALVLHSDADGAHAILAIAQLLDGRSAEAVATARAEPDQFWRRWALAHALYADGDLAAADAELAWMTANHADDGAFQIAQLHAQRGDADATFHWLDRAIETGDPGRFEIHYVSFLGRFSDDPRYADFLRRVGLPAKRSSAAEPALSR